MTEELDLPDSLFIPSDADLQEAGDVPPEEAAAPPEPENTVQHQNQIPESMIQEIIRDRDLSRQEAAQLRAMVFKMGERLEQVNQNQNKAPAEPQWDQDVDALIAPMIEARLDKRLAMLLPTVQNLQAQNESNAAWNFVTQQVPDLESLGPQIGEHLKSLPQARAIKLLSDPEDIIDLAEKIRLKNQLREASGSEAANRDLRSRGRGEVPGHTRQATHSKDPFADLNNLSEDKFQAQLRRMGLL